MEDLIQNCSYQDNAELIRKFQEGNQNALDAVCRCNSGLVGRMAQKYAVATGLPYDDFYQEGMIGLIQAAKKFDPDHGASFSTYASWYLFQTMQKYADQNIGMIRIPVNVLQDVRNAVSLNGQYASIPQEKRTDMIAEKMGMSAPHIRRLLGIGYQFSHYLSLDTPVTDEDQNTTLAHMIADTKDTVDTISVSRAREDTVSILLGYLTPRQQYIVQLRNGLAGEDPYTLEQIGKILGISKARVRAIEVKAYYIMRMAARKKNISSEDLLTDPETYSICGQNGV